MLTKAGVDRQIREATIAAIGPDTGPHTLFLPPDRTITFSRNLLWQEIATFAISTIAANHVMKTSSRHPRLPFNTYFRGENPLADEVYGRYSRLALGETPDLTRGTWHFLGARPDSALITDLRGQLQTHLASFQFELQFCK